MCSDTHFLKTQFDNFMLWILYIMYIPKTFYAS